VYLRNDGFSGYNSAGEQIRQRGLFLLFVQCDGRECQTSDCAKFKVCVRKVAMRQLGHWMMGSANVGGKWHTVSGSYGGDGLPITVPHDIYSRLTVELPPELHEAWNKGGGWNSAGSEAAAVREWALSNLEALRK
jgi:hypothetical protein